MKAEAKVGLFVLIGLVSLFLLSMQVSKITNITKDGYLIYAYFENLTGLDTNAKVKIGGVDVGYVKEKMLEGNRPKISMIIYEGIKIPADSIVLLGQDSLLGTKFVEIKQGMAPTYLSEGQVIQREIRFANFAETATSINEAANELKLFVKELRGAFDPEARQNLQDAIANFKTMAASVGSAADKFGAMSGEFKTTGSTINDKLPKILSQIDDLSREFAQTGKDVNKKLPEIMDRFTAIEKDLQDVIKENKQPLNSAIKSVDSFFANGNDTVKKLDKYISKGMNSTLEVSLRAESMAKDKYTKGYFGADYSPAPTKHYLVELVSTRDNSIMDASKQYVEAEKHSKGKTYISAQFGKRYENTMVRGGIIESTGGVGVDYFAAKDKLKMSAEVYDFGAQNDVRGNKAHAKVSARYRLLKHVDLIAGYDNFLNKKAANVFGGVGISFVDDDLKYVVGGASSFVK
jgi:phospholipid/cholesterol/gamma-HCH transport system substrate-binding protein